MVDIPGRTGVHLQFERWYSRVRLAPGIIGGRLARGTQVEAFSYRLGSGSDEPCFAGLPVGYEVTELDTNLISPLGHDGFVCGRLSWAAAEPTRPFPSLPRVLRAVSVSLTIDRIVRIALGCLDMLPPTDPSRPFEVGAPFPGGVAPGNVRIVLRVEEEVPDVRALPDLFFYVVGSPFPRRSRNL